MLSPVRRRRGFTIVELLVTVGIMAVIASISIVAYAGVTQRAQDVEAQDFVESLNRAVKSFSLGNWDMPVAGNNSATTDEFAVVRALQYQWPAALLKPGSPYFSPKYNPTVSSNTSTHRIRWNGVSFQLLLPGTNGSGLLKTFSGGDYTSTDYVWPVNTQPSPP